MGTIGGSTYLIMFTGLFFVYVVSIIIDVQDEESEGKNRKIWLVVKLIIILLYLLMLAVIMKVI